MLTSASYTSYMMSIAIDGPKRERPRRRRMTFYAPAGYELLERYANRGIARRVADQFAAADAQIIRRPGRRAKPFEIWLQP